MDSGLWGVASTKLREAAGNPELTPARQAEILILLAETLVRGSEPTRALELLEQTFVSSLPNAGFWRGQALAGNGRFADAVEVLREIAADPSNEYAEEAALTAASLQLSLSLPEEALDSLSLITESADSSHRIQSKIRRMEILLDLGRVQEARALSPDPANIPEKMLPLVNFLEGSLLLAEEKPSEAEVIFNNLLANPSGQTISRFSLAAIGKADAIAAQDKKTSATESLLTFIQSNPDAPLLDSMFRRIVDWLPKKIISADHPTLIRLAEWIPQTAPTASGLINTIPDTVTAAWPAPSPEISDLAVFAMHARAIGLHRVPTPVAKEEARLLLQRIRLLAPRHFLASHALLALAKWHLENGESNQAFALFDSLRQTAKSPLVKGEAAFLDAKIAYDRGDTSLASDVFNQAASLLSGTNRNTALLNAALARLEEDSDAPILIQDDDPSIAKSLNTEVALEQALTKSDPVQATYALDNFLTANPDHPRAAEARVAIVEAALASVPPDLTLARAQLDTLKASGTPLPLDLETRLALAELRLTDQLGKTELAVELAREIISRFPETPASSEASLIMGKSLFRSGNYNEARQVLDKLATSDPGTQRSQAALLLAARSAALGATEQSREEALTLFDRTIAIDGPLRSLAILEKARLHIDLNRLPAAIDSLSAAYRETQPDDPSRLPTGLLLAEAIYAKGDSAPESLIKAIEIYNELIALTANNPAQFFRLQYLRGLTLEKIPDPINPGQNRLGDALSAYFSVLDRPVDPPPPEWEWFERSGFRALSLLENAGRWQAAISIAEKIASFGGPRSEEAATRARQLRLKHMIWED